MYMKKIETIAQQNFVLLLENFYGQDRNLVVLNFAVVLKIFPTLQILMDTGNNKGFLSYSLEKNYMMS